VAVGAIHLVPEFLAGEGVLADEKRAELVVDYGGGAFFDGAIEAFGATRSADAEIDGCVDDFVRAGGFVGVGCGAEFVVDVEGIDLLLAVDACFVGVAAVELEEFDSFDFQWAV
jgi:hypothetical protein